MAPGMQQLAPACKEGAKKHHPTMLLYTSRQGQMLASSDWHASAYLVQAIQLKGHIAAQVQSIQVVRVGEQARQVATWW